MCCLVKEYLKKKVLSLFWKLKVWHKWFTFGYILWFLNLIFYFLQQNKSLLSEASPSRMGFASRTCCSIQECWPLIAARNCRISFVLSVFPAPDSPLQRQQEWRSVKAMLHLCQIFGWIYGVSDTWGSQNEWPKQIFLTLSIQPWPHGQIVSLSRPLAHCTDSSMGPTWCFFRPAK